jgi:hypothetical protein
MRWTDTAAQTAADQPGNAASCLIEHSTPVHIARIAGAFRAWSDGGDATLPHSPYPWFVSFPRDEN